MQTAGTVRQDATVDQTTEIAIHVAGVVNDDIRIECPDVP